MFSFFFIFRFHFETIFTVYFGRKAIAICSEHTQHVSTYRTYIIGKDYDLAFHISYVVCVNFINE